MAPAIRWAIATNAARRNRMPHLTSGSAHRTSVLSSKGRRTGERSRYNWLNHIPGHIGQPEIAPAVAISEARVIETHQVQDGRMQVMHVDGILHGFVSELVGAAVGHAAGDAAAGQ